MTTTKERTYQIVIGVLVLVILIGAWFAFARRDDMSGNVNGDMVATSTQNVNASSSALSSGATGSTSSIPSTNTMTVSGDTISVASQAAGMSVAVASVTLLQSTWIAIRDSQGRTLGAALFSAGTHADVSVPLLRGTTSGQSYQALLYVDDGDKQFDLHKDTLVLGSDGSVAGVTFNVQ